MRVRVDREGVPEHTEAIDRDSRAECFGRTSVPAMATSAGCIVKKTELSGKTVQELRALAKASGLKGYSAMKKARLIDLLAVSGSSGAQPRKTRAAPARRAGEPVRAKK